MLGRIRLVRVSLWKPASSSLKIHCLFVCTWKHSTSHEWVNVVTLVFPWQLVSLEVSYLKTNWLTQWPPLQAAGLTSWVPSIAWWDLKLEPVTTTWKGGSQGLTCLHASFSHNIDLLSIEQDNCLMCLETCQRSGIATQKYISLSTAMTATQLLFASIFIAIRICSSWIFVFHLAEIHVQIWMSDTSLVWECIPRLLISFGIVAGIAICLHMTLPCDIGILIWHWPHGLWAYRADQNSYILLICLCTLMICICPVLQAEHLCICNNVFADRVKAQSNAGSWYLFFKTGKEAVECLGMWKLTC